jgi:hypothetical protein
MSYCPKLFEKVKKSIDEKKSIEEIGKDVCGKVKFPERKIRRIIRISFGKKNREEAQRYLEEHAEILKYKKPNNPSGINKPTVEVKNFTSKKEETSEGLVETPEETSEGLIPETIKTVESNKLNFKPEDEEPEQEPIQIDIKPTVRNHLNYIKENITYKYGKPIETDNSAIIFLLRASGLWDYERFREKSIKRSK